MENELTPEESARLQELREALESEFRTDEARKSPLNDIEDLKGDMLEALRHTLRHSENEALKAKVAMWGYSTLLDVGKASKDGLVDLLEGVPKPDASRT